MDAHELLEGVEVAGAGAHEEVAFVVEHLTLLGGACCHWIRRSSGGLVPERAGLRTLPVLGTQPSNAGPATYQDLRLCKKPAAGGGGESGLARDGILLVPGACSCFTDRLSCQGRQHPATEPA